MCNPILFSLFLQNVEIKHLDFAYPFLLCGKDIFLSKQIIKVVMVFFNKKCFPQQILLPFKKGMHYCQHFILVCGFCLLTWFKLSSFEGNQVFVLHAKMWKSWVFSIFQNNFFHPYPMWKHPFLLVMLGVIQFGRSCKQILYNNF